MPCDESPEHDVERPKERHQRKQQIGLAKKPPPGGDEKAWRLTAVAIVIALGALILSEIVARTAHRRLAQFE